jgi:leader peptidase (prepilin peptidase)/N-methyltransferase
MVWLHYALIFLGGLGVGSLINWAIYTLAYNYRPISPWSPAPANLPPRTWLDRLPVIGWWRLRREENVHGPWFWIRPILIELGYASFIVWLFHFETNDGLLPRSMEMVPPSFWYPLFATHALLIALITVATFIDFDERMIPDTITLPGTILLLILTTAWQTKTVDPPLWSTGHLPHLVKLPEGGLTPEPLLVHTPKQIDGAWPVLDGWPGLALALAILWGWYVAMLHGVVWLRQGWGRAVRLYVASIFRHNQWQYLGLVFVVLSLATAGVWWLGGPRWHSLYTSLVGLAFAGGLVWGVRIGGYIGLRREAMGFGDVTLMIMIGAAIGWQASLLVFFLSPFTAVVVGLAQLAITGRQELAFGPYLSLATVVVIVAWVALWEHYARVLFELGNLIPFMVISFLLLMTGTLMWWRMIRERLFGIDSAQ